ncbi:hypothetical protein OG762_52350 (plasmid) [Streptomyces sp. NBC_01136]|uniref:hypothetical protein n=1 Tax=Streptomyces sp. NBC_01136 TaxID=2903754 RepID=UPI0037DDCE54|nr:hypothetical protein OG762_52350 [Streptomyces sp. NBC_01136]
MKAKGRTSAFALKMRPEERTIAERVQAWAAAAGLAVSLNDVFCHLIRRAEIPVPLSPGEGLAGIHAHWADCPDCESYRGPQCLDGLYLRELNKRASSGVLVPDAL